MLLTVHTSVFLQVYCVMEMEMTDCLLPWNSKLTTNSEAAAGWTDDQLDRMADDKLDFVVKACKEVRVPGVAHATPM